MSDLALRLIAVVLFVLLAFVGAFFLIRWVHAYFRLRNPALFPALPPVRAALRQMLFDHDGEMVTCVIDVKPPMREQPLRSGPRAIEAAPVSRSRS